MDTDARRDDSVVYAALLDAYWISEPPPRPERRSRGWLRATALSCAVACVITAVSLAAMGELS
ncbi:hypothetical protein [Streptomyces luteolus]|uniref:Uncharacterized protein n=1 Tax=Streptomyces luteolus TaxID=3043615 RepID=A0ABT6T8U3_9ACTN|nr:hypothetical protein [Streptomyces sp. B-S-A12]MDI3424100.1 hypothetical protein [Streptomyces sp. B-S-A12]